MKSSFIQAIQYMRIAQEFFSDFIRDHPKTKGADIARNYSNKLSWVFSDLLSKKEFTEQVKQAVRSELNGDVLSVPEINHKISLLCIEKRELVEEIVDHLLKNEDFEIVKK